MRGLCNTGEVSHSSAVLGTVEGSPIKRPSVKSGFGSCLKVDDPVSDWFGPDLIRRVRSVAQMNEEQRAELKRRPSTVEQQSPVSPRLLAVILWLGFV